ncbi:unnamed protein product, partial [marine sediment metagenome]
MPITGIKKSCYTIAISQNLGADNMRMEKSRIFGTMEFSDP